MARLVRIGDNDANPTTYRECQRVTLTRKGAKTETHHVPIDVEDKTAWLSRELNRDPAKPSTDLAECELTWHPTKHADRTKYREI
jgi:hypothetical protein